jgi:hypothetical protein
MHFIELCLRGSVNSLIHSVEQSEVASCTLQIVFLPMLIAPFAVCTERVVDPLVQRSHHYITILFMRHETGVKICLNANYRRN